MLRPIGIGDLHTTHAYAADMDNTRYMMILPNKTLADTRRFLEEAEAEWRKESPAFYEFAVTLDGAHIGCVGAHLNKRRTGCEVSWILHRDHWGHGYASEAAQALLDFVVQELGVRTVTAHCDAANTASARVMHKLGLVRLPIVNARQYPDGRAESVEHVYALRVKPNGL